ANVTANALLRGARGNSGVILSLLFRGFAKAVKEKDAIDGRDFAIALDFGVAAAYKAVMKPAEGTILTVSRMSAAAAAAAARENPAVEYVLEKAIEEGLKTLDQTTDMNPVLKKAGVVDSGGKGFLVILQGMMDELRGLPMPEGAAGESHNDKADFAALGDEDITFTYDTVFIVRKQKEDVNLEPFRAYLNSIGDSLVIGESDEEFKVHVHTDTPGAALTESQKYGTLELAKIENMRTQAEDLAAGKHVQSTDDLDAVEAELESGETTPAEPVIAAPEKKYGVVAVCAGEGMAAVFRDLGADGVISGGQTMNPATEDILRQINATPAEVVFVLPNNKNIIMAAQQCIGLAEGKQVVVIESKTVPQGVTALMMLDTEAGVEDNVQTMSEAMEAVSTAEVTYAARDSDFGGFAIKQGDHMALLNGKLFDTHKNQEKLLKKLAKDDIFQNAEFINIYYGEDVKESEAEKTLKLFTEACPKAEINLLSGGQPVYYYMISAE
ncbi:MAG: DAK2 domain-containing protein, partial [Oscillospiraceae bacterium]|nr:DAK2 domain-containing protein [Oscillospiraceae bacterium]